MDLFHILTIPKDISKIFRGIVPKLVVEEFENPDVRTLLAELDDVLHTCGREGIPREVELVVARSILTTKFSLHRLAEFGIAKAAAREIQAAATTFASSLTFRSSAAVPACTAPNCTSALPRVWTAGPFLGRTSVILRLLCRIVWSRGAWPGFSRNRDLRVRILPPLRGATLAAATAAVATIGSAAAAVTLGGRAISNRSLD